MPFTAYLCFSSAAVCGCWIRLRPKKLLRSQEVSRARGVFCRN